MTDVPSNAFTNYISAPDASYRWEKRGEELREGVRITDLHLVSQTWQGLRWEHRLQVFCPDALRETETALLYNTGLSGSEEETLTGMLFAQATGMVCAFLFHIPNQPLFEGLAEDALIAYTLQQYLESGEEDWPLLFPMVKSVVRAMDALQAFSPSQTGQTITRFVVSGASKRGWNSWLTAAVEPRVAGIIPMVYDNLNLFAQMPHQIEVWGDYSAQIGDYTDLDLQARMRTERGQQLAQMIDPYTYCDRITQPKLIINGTNDAYWATDALNLYWDALPPPKNVLYVPNAGHGLRDPQRVFDATVAFVRAIGAKTLLPTLYPEFEPLESSVRLRMSSSTPAIEARIWQAHSPTLDFRGAYWQSIPMAAMADTMGFQGEAVRTIGTNMALFGEATFADEERTYTLSTPLRIVRAN